MFIARYSATIIGGRSSRRSAPAGRVLVDGGAFFLVSAVLLASIRLPGGAGRAAAPSFLRAVRMADAADPAPVVTPA